MKEIVEMLLNWYKRGAKKKRAQKKPWNLSSRDRISLSGISMNQPGSRRNLFLKKQHPFLQRIKSKNYTTTDLFNYLHLQKHYPAAMRGVALNRLGRMMTALGIKRIHTEYGNVYRWVKLKVSSSG